MLNKKNKFIKLDAWQLILYLIVLVFVVVFSIINILKFRIFSTTFFGWSSFYACSKIIFYHVPLRIFVIPEYSVGLIFKPIHYLYALIFSIFPNPEAWGVFETIIFGAAAIVGFLLAKKIFKNSFLAFVFSLAFLLNPIITTAGMLGFVCSAIALILFLASFYYLENGNLNKFMLFIFLANLSDVGAVVTSVLLGVILIFSKNRKNFGKKVLVLSIPWLVIVLGITWVYLKSLNRSFPVAFPHLDAYGDSMNDVLHFVLYHPFSIIKNIFNEKNFFLMLFFSFPNWLSFFSPLFLLAVIPESIYLLIRNQHASAHFIIMPFIFLSSLYGMKKIIIACLRNNRQMELKLFLIYKLFPALLLVSIIISHFNIKPKTDFGQTLGPIPFTKDFEFNYYHYGKHEAIGYKLLKLIPKKSTCLTLQSISTHLSGCRELGIFNKIFLKENYPWEYIFLDLNKDDFYHIAPSEYFFRLRDFISKKEYGVLAYEDGWLLLKRGHSCYQNEEVLNLLKIFENKHGILN